MSSEDIDIILASWNKDCCPNVKIFTLLFYEAALRSQSDAADHTIIRKNPTRKTKNYREWGVMNMIKLPMLEDFDSTNEQICKGWVPNYPAFRIIRQGKLLNNSRIDFFTIYRNLQ